MKIEWEASGLKRVLVVEKGRRRGAPEPGGARGGARLGQGQRLRGPPSPRLGPRERQGEQREELLLLLLAFGRRQRRRRLGQRRGAHPREDYERVRAERRGRCCLDGGGGGRKGRRWRQRRQAEDGRLRKGRRWFSSYMPLQRQQYINTRNTRERIGESERKTEKEKLIETKINGG